MSTIVHQGKLRGDKIRYDTETWCCAWYPPVGEVGDDVGHCFDFNAEDIDDMIALLQKLKAMEADDGEG